MWPQKILWLPAHLKSQERGWMNCVPTRSSFHGCQCHPGMTFIAQKYLSQLFHGQKNPMLSYLTSQNTKLNRNQSQAFMPVTSEHNHCMSLILVLFHGGHPVAYRSLSALLEQHTGKLQEHEQLSSGHGKGVRVTLISRGYNPEEALETI